MTPPVTPTTFLLLLLGLLAVALTITVAANFWRSRRICAQARKMGMQFSRPDRFILGRRVAGCLPIPGAAEVIVRDVAYSTTPAGLMCVMTASFTIGTVGHRRQVRRVCAALDPGGRELMHFRMLDGKPSAEQYAAAHEQLVAAAGSGGAVAA